MPLEELIKEIEAEARSAAEKIRKEGAVEAEQITADAKARAKEILGSEKHSVESNVERMRRQSLSSVEVERRMLTISAKEESIERELKQVKKAVASDLERNYMKKLLDAALKSFGESVPKGEMIAVTNKTNAKLAAKLGLKVKIDNSIKGFRLQSKDGRIALNAEVDDIVEGNLSLIRNVLAKQLFKK